MIMTRFLPIYDDEPGSAGEGITRTTDPRAKLFALEVKLPGRLPMRCTVKALNESQAIQFAVARHPSTDPSRIRTLTKSEAGGLL